MLHVIKSDDERCLQNKSLGIDNACISIFNNYNESLSLYSNFDNCNECYGLPWANLSAKKNTTLLVSTKYPVQMYITNHNQQQDQSRCLTKYEFVEHGYYGWNISNEQNCSSIYTIIEPSNPYLPLFATCILIIITLLTFATTKFTINLVKKIKIMRRHRQSDLLDQSQEEEDEQFDDDDDQEENADGSVATIAPPLSIRITRASMRISSIDTFRGIAILLMIFVNNGGGGYVIFNHSPWYGLTIADLILPCFAWIMGTTIVLSLRTQQRLSISRSRIIYKCLRRSMILIALGLVINGHGYASKKIDLKNLRFPGVLQLLGITNFISTSIETIGIKTSRNGRYGKFAFLQDILDAWAQWLIIIILVTIHFLLTFLLPVPECPTTGYLGPGGYEYHGKYKNCTGGAAGYIDRLIFGNHTYTKTHNIIYGHVLPHDPEGLMNTLSAILIVQFGIQAGRILFCYYLHNISKILRWFSWAIFIGIIAFFLCGWNNTGIIPISKNMMTISFVLTSSCFAFILFSILYYLIDHHRVWNGAPFVYAGTNSIFLYVGHYLTMNCFPWTWKINSPSHTLLLAMNLWTTILWAIIAHILYKKDVIITV